MEHHFGPIDDPFTFYFTPILVFFSLLTFPLGVSALSAPLTVKSSPNNPSNKIVGQANTVNYKTKSSKPLHIRLKEQLGNDNILSQEILPAEYPIVPLWLVPSVQCCTTNISKKNSSPQQIQAQFLEHDYKHRKDYKIYADGSKSNDGVGCAVVTEEISEVARLPNFASSFTAELSAIVHGLKNVHNTKRKSFVIYSDSRSAIQAICK